MSDRVPLNLGPLEHVEIAAHGGRIILLLVAHETEILAELSPTQVVGLQLALNLTQEEGSE